jgi:predicted methyltransferase
MTDRSAEDLALDAGRKPEALMAFAKVSPGMRVLEIGAAGGYTTEVLARAVGPTGVVYAQNPARLRAFADAALVARLATPGCKNVVKVDRELDDPAPPEAKPLELVVMNVIYHDAVWTRVDRAKMNRAIFEALKPGGRFVVIDSSARPGSGDADAEKLHRIDEQLVRSEVESAGFKLEAEGDLFRNPADGRDWNSAGRAAGERRGTSDRFALRFVRP